jgi:tRNA wybutosine-synthesizing protein 1
MCLFCWRYQGFTEKDFKKFDDPKFILEESINAQRRLLTGFKGDPRCDKKKWKQANEPNMIACSLSGEPTIYPKLSDFFYECHKLGITTFLVTNGTNPKALVNMDNLPKQLYISVVAPNKSLYKKLCSPVISKGWERFKKTLEILPSLNTRVVIRHTLIQGWNMKNKYFKEYAKLDDIVRPDFIEPKGYVFVGYSRKRMNLKNMPSHKSVKEFGKKIGELIGYELINEKEDSRVVLLSNKQKVPKI